MYILDTKTLIYFFKGVGNVSAHLLSKSPQEISIPTVVLYELQVGIEKSTHPQKRKKQLEVLVSRVTVSSFDVKEACIAATIRADLERKGTPIGPYDILIAAIALSSKSILVTHNTKDRHRKMGIGVIA